MAPKYIKRVTLFKIPKEEDVDAVLAEYDLLRKTAEKVSLTSFTCQKPWKVGELSSNYP